MAHIWSAAIRPILLYGIHCVNLSKSSISKLEKIQAKLITTALGIRNSCHNTPLLKALRISSVRKSIDMSCLLLLKSAICSSSRCNLFYAHEYSKSLLNKKIDKHGLLARSHKICNTYNISLSRFIYDDRYSAKISFTAFKYVSVCVSVCPANILVFYFSAIRRDIDLKFIQDIYRVVLNSLKKK